MKKNVIRFLAYFQFFYALIIILFWISFFVFEKNNPENSEIYIAHELAFPVPDIGFIMPCLIVGGIGLLNKKSYGFLFSLISASSSIFLTLLDTTFSIQQGLFTKNLADGIMFISFAILLLLYGLFVINYFWKYRKEFI